MNVNIKEYQEWLERRNLSTHTIRGYIWTIREYRNKELTTENIVEFFKAKLTRYQPNSLKGMLYSLSSYAKFRKITVEWEIITKLIPTVQRKYFATIDQTELELLKQTKTKTSLKINQRNNLLLDFLFWAGIRINELINIKHCDFSQEMLKIYGKGNKVRYVFLPEFLIKEFQPNSDNYLFQSSKGEKLSNTRARMIVYQKVAKAGIKKNISPHTFRRSFATLLNNRDCHLTTIQKLLGHSSIETTTSYIHNSYKELYQDYSKLWNSPPSLTPPPPCLLPTSLKNRK